MTNLSYNEITSDKVCKAIQEFLDKKFSRIPSTIVYDEHDKVFYEKFESGSYDELARASLENGNIVVTTSWTLSTHENDLLRMFYHKILQSTSRKKYEDLDNFGYSKIYTPKKILSSELGRRDVILIDNNLRPYITKITEIDNGRPFRYIEQALDSVENLKNRISELEAENLELKRKLKKKKTSRVLK